MRRRNTWLVALCSALLRDAMPPRWVCLRRFMLVCSLRAHVPCMHFLGDLLARVCLVLLHGGIPLLLRLLPRLREQKSTHNQKHVSKRKHNTTSRTPLSDDALTRSTSARAEMYIVRQCQSFILWRESTQQECTAECERGFPTLLSLFTPICVGGASDRAFARSRGRPRPGVERPKRRQRRTSCSWRFGSE